MWSSFFDRLSITHKMVIIMMFASTVSVLIASASLGVSEALNYRAGAAENVATLGDVVGTNSTAALLFEDAALAEQVLQSLAADEDITRALVFYPDATALASYPGDLELGSETLAIEAMTWDAAESGTPVERIVGLQFIDSVRPVYFDNELLGFIYVRSSLSAVVDTVQRIAIMAAITVLVTILVGWFLSTRLHPIISSPVLELSRLMKQVTSKQDYSVRAIQSSRDEIGSLMSGFNDMLEQISVRDLQLADTNQKLKKAIRESLHAKRTAESASRAKSDFLARMSHEIRTPMNGVLGMTELLLSSNLEDRDRNFAKTIQQSGIALLDVINDILDFSKIEAGRLELEEHEFDLGDVLESVVDLLYNRAHAQGVELIADIDPETPLRVFGDGVRLRQVLVNLVGNAVKFTQDGEIVLRLSTETIDGGKLNFRFEVQDSGIGIAADKVDLIFDSFAQADVSTTRRYGGTGLGLAISKQLVELMGGEIGVRSKQDIGSTFWISVPMPIVIEPQSDPLLTDISRQDLRALVVDDNATNCEIFEKQLAVWNIESTVANCVDDAVEVLQSHAERGEYFDVILLDFFMPGKDGFALARTVRKRTDLGDPSILMLSSAGSDYTKTEADKAGVDMHLTKPVRRSRLHKALCEVLQKDRDSGRHEAANDSNTSTGLPQFGLDILLVEDIPINLQVAQHMLNGLGCKVIEAQNGEQALQAIRDHRPDLVLMDCQMPIMDGYTATRVQREREANTGQHIPIIALTANALDEDRQKCLDAGMDDFVSKPFKRQELIDALTRWAGDPKPVCEQAEVSVDNKPDTVIDPEALQQIAQLDPDSGDALVCQIIDSYIETASDLVAELAVACKNLNAAEIARIAHALKSSSANVGAIRLSDLCSRIELQARDGDAETASGELAQTTNEYDAVSAELMNTRKELAA